MPTTFDLHPLIAASLLLLLLFAVDGDLRARRIPNALSLGGLALGLLLNFALNGTDGGRDALLGAVAGGSMLLPLWLLRGLGGGDVKLMAAVGAHVGFATAVVAALSTLLVGGAMAIIVLLRRRARRHAADAARPHRNDFPYAPAIAVGSVFAAILPLIGIGLVP